jgi:hypothetical protein
MVNLSHDWFHPLKVTLQQLVDFLVFLVDFNPSSMKKVVAVHKTDTEARRVTLV